MTYWAYEIGEEPTRCYRRYPPFPGEKPSSASTTDVRIDEFVKYTQMLADMDPQCREEEALAHPRFFIGAWIPFVSNPMARKFWIEDWSSGRQAWSPPGLKDLTGRWAKMFAATTGHELESALASLDRVQLAPAGAITRLHIENNSAHAWYGQCQGKRAFILFSPAESSNLYAKETGEPKRGSEEQREYSPVDIFHPNDKHCKFKNCTAHYALLGPGEILVVPRGWWLYSVTLEPSVTLVRKFWNRSNKAGLCEELIGLIDEDGMEESLRLHFEELAQQFRDEVNDDHASDEDDDDD